MGEAFPLVYGRCGAPAIRDLIVNRHKLLLQIPITPAERSGKFTATYDWPHTRGIDQLEGAKGISSVVIRWEMVNPANRIAGIVAFHSWLKTLDRTGGGQRASCRQASGALRRQSLHRREIEKAPNGQINREEHG